MTEERLNGIAALLDTHKLDAALILSYENYRYFSGFTGSNCALIISRGKRFALSDGRYDVQLREQAGLFSPVIIKRPMSEHIAELLRDNKLSRVGFESAHMTYNAVDALKKSAPEIDFVPIPDFGLRLRMQKDKRELECITRAAAIADDALAALMPRLSANTTEREAAALLEYEMARRGSERPAFETIAASGSRSAMPHAEPTDNTLPENGVLTLDFGACVGGYRSDITRTLLLGSPSAELLRLWELVFDVQQKCVARVRPGVSARELDAYARELFAAHDMDKYFSHSLGHGVGLAIHEEPSLSRSATETLAEGMVITIEPGHYIPEVGGVRIEDTVLVTADGGTPLTRAPHRLAATLR